LKRPAVRLATLLAVVATAFAATTGVASAKPSCGQQVIDDWYGSTTGQLRRIYPVHCYRDALNMLKGRTDLEVYSNASQDIKRAMELAIALGNSKGNGNGPGGGTTQYSTALPSFLGGPDGKEGGKPPTEVEPYPPKNNPGPIPTVLHGSSPSSVPLPAIILGAIAALLLALGATAYLARRRQQRRQTLRPRHANGRTP
jgi:hypothetical protein